MNEMYGTLWTNSQGEEPNESWAISINALSNDEIGRGLTAIRDCGKTFPPTLPEFMGMCRNSDWEHRASRITAQEALTSTPVDLGDSVLLESSDTATARTMGTPASNPNYFKDLMNIIK